MPKRPTYEAPEDWRKAINQLGMVPPKNMVILGMVYEIGFTLSNLSI
jgi:uncharacterized protein YjeT (DUF2065 family)